MNKQVSKKGMPLKLWAWAFVLAGFILVSLFSILSYRSKHLLGNQLQLIEFEKTSQDTTQRLDFYFVGSSLSREALFKEKQIQFPIKTDEVEITYKAAIIGSSCLSNFNIKIDEIKKLRPKYLFIESNIACINLESNFRGRVLLVPQNFIKIMKENFKPNSQDKNNLENPETAVDIANGILFDIRKLDEFPLWNEFFKEAPELGIKIILLEIPRSIEADQLILKNVKIEYNNLIKAYKREFDIDYIPFPNKISRNKYYLDRAHFNKTGSIYYTNWLMNEFQKRNILTTN